jgi:phospholipid-binding lipoprotein MlaA
MIREHHQAPPAPLLWLVALALLTLALVAGCTRAPGVPGPDGVARGVLLTETDDDAADYDPWQPFNEVMFSFNHDVLDRFLVKPAATGWEVITPLPVRKSIAHAFDNLEMPRRLVNNVLQLRPVGAGREVARFVVNTTAGVAGLFDVATIIHVPKSDADTGQTLALYGLGAGPYVVLPTMPPLTVRDAIGHAADGMLDPVGYFLPFVANQAKSILSAVNERSLNLKLYADVEDSVLDLYSAARNGYLQRRRLVVRRAYTDRDEQWQWAFRAVEPDDRPMVAENRPATVAEDQSATVADGASHTVTDESLARGADVQSAPVTDEPSAAVTDEPAATVPAEPAPTVAVAVVGDPT